MSAMKCFELFETEKSVKESWPLSKFVLRDFVSWAIFKRNLKSSTVQSYLGSLLQMHKLNDLSCDSFYDAVLKSMIRGAENLSFYKDMSKGTKKVMTLPLLKILGHRISSSDWEDDTKQVFWTALVIAFFGSFRFGEILCRSESSHNKSEVLLWEDIIFRKDSVTIKIKIPKTRNLKGECVDLFEIDEVSYCPVRALVRLRKLKGQSICNKEPVFMFKTGIFLTSVSLNATLYELLNPVIGAVAAGQISGHSFRAALPSALARCPDLVAEEDIKLWGRWSSSSFKRYTRLTPNKRRKIFGQIVSSLNIV